MQLSQELIKTIVESVNSVEKREARSQDYLRWLFYSGATKQIILDALSKEFKKPETIEALEARLVPLNIMQKVVNKLAGVYTESPMRAVVDQNSRDQELVGLYEDSMALNKIKKEGNRYFKLFKRNLEEIYIDKKGHPKLRNLPRHTYEVFSFDSVSPEVPEIVVKILKDSPDREKQLLSIYTDESNITVDGYGRVVPSANAGVNPYKTLPFIYTNESTSLIDPIPDDDLYSVSVAIPIVLSDLLYATKYQCWSIIYTIGAVGDIPVNPNSVLGLDFGPNGEKPEVGTIKPSVDTEKIIQLVTNILSILLTTKNLSAGTIQSTVTVSDAISGISKMLDNAESVEDKKDQQAFFYTAESDLWTKLSKNMVPVWRANNLLAPEFNTAFSEPFEVSVTFREPKAFISERETVELAEKKLQIGLTTRKIELARLYPDKSSDEIDMLEEEIDEEFEDDIEELNDEAQPEDQDMMDGEDSEPV